MVFTHDELRSLFLFADLSDEQLDWVRAHAARRDAAAGERFFAEGEPATCFFVLLSGTIRVTRRVRGDEVDLTRSSQPGAYCGATQPYVDEEQTYRNSGVADTDVALLELPAREWGAALRSWFPLAMHLLEGMFLGMRTSDAVIGQRERLLALGALSAGLTHELNNPAAAALRATGALRERVAGMRHKLHGIATGKIDPSVVRELVDLQEEAVARVATAPRLTAMQASDAEDEIADWLSDNNVSGGWDLAPVLVSGGIDAEWLEKVARTVPSPSLLEGAVRWLAYAVETETLMNDITDATTRISTLVASARQYSQLDRAPYQESDLHALLDSTLVMLGRKLGSVTVVRRYAAELPLVPAYAAELNQVWTNIIDNALWAMNGTGTLTLTTAVDAPWAVVTITDTGPGIPADLIDRIFEPFFTTKPVGEGTGLGLDISWRIIVNKHRGDLRVTSTPGDTRFDIRLPLTTAPADLNA
ncbi:MAG TPA: ATP-binding protein [Pseudonocardiaceae bacterium]